MRIAIINSFGQIIGGCESYLSDLIPALQKSGEEVAFWHEHEGLPAEPKVVSTGISQWCADRLGVDASLDALRQWRPDLLYVHGFSDPRIEQRLLQIAPAAAFLHGYSGACISGTKLWKYPLVPCSRKFGAACLLEYYPRRCGGLNPLVMWREFQRHKSRLQLLHQYRALLTHSDHMVDTFRNQGIAEERLFKVPFPVRQPAIHKPVSRAPQRPWKLLFIGRCDHTKGGQLLLDALPLVLKRLDGPVEMIFAGTGPERHRWEARAQDIMQRFPRLTIRFLGWIQPDRQSELVQSSDLLIFPSVWPEPFGMAGAEAVRAGLPVAAFNVGGVTEWLQDGKTGWIAPGASPTKTGLTEAILQGLTRQLPVPPQSSERHTRCEMAAHLEALLPILYAITSPGGSRNPVNTRPADAPHR